MIIYIVANLTATYPTTQIAPNTNTSEWMFNNAAMPVVSWALRSVHHTREYHRVSIYIQNTTGILGVTLLMIILIYWLVSSGHLTQVFWRRRLDPIDAASWAS